MIQLTNVSKQFLTPTGKYKTVVHPTTLSIPPGQMTGLIGPSGAGKSTLLRLMNGLLKPDTGSVVASQKMGMIFQNFNLLQTLTVWDNIALPLKCRKDPLALQKSRVQELATLCHLSEYLHQYPKNLSGGQQQRVGIARALATQPAILLADEATSALDPESTQNILHLLMTLNETLDLTIVMVTHEMQVIKQVCDHVVVLSDGAIVETGTTLDLFLNPQHRITQGMVAQVLHTLLPPHLHIHSLYRIAYIGSLSSKPLLSLMTQQFDVTVNILQASIEPIKQHLLGIMLVSLEGSAIKKGIAFLKEQGCRVEALHDVD